MIKPMKLPGLPYKYLSAAEWQEFLAQSKPVCYKCKKLIDENEGYYRIDKQNYCRGCADE